MRFCGAGLGNEFAIVVGLEGWRLGFGDWIDLKAGYDRATILFSALDEYIADRACQLQFDGGWVITPWGQGMPCHCHNQL